MKIAVRLADFSKMNKTIINKPICIIPQFSPYKTIEIRVVIDLMIMDDLKHVLKHVLKRAMTKQNFTLYYQQKIKQKSMYGRAFLKTGRLSILSDCYD